MPRFVAAVAGVFLVWIAGDMFFSTSVVKPATAVAVLLLSVVSCFRLYISSEPCLLRRQIRQCDKNRT